jgi:hypothetical protein
MIISDLQHIESVTEVEEKAQGGCYNCWGQKGGIGVSNSFILRTSLDAKSTKGQYSYSKG